MTKKQILSGNRLIAEFMGYKYFPSHSINEIKGVLKQEGKASVLLDDTKSFSVRYRFSWDWIMPAVDKVRDCNCLVSIRFNRQLNTTTTVIACFEDKWGKDIQVSDEGIKSAYLAVIEFIKWYNEKKEPKPTNP